MQKAYRYGEMALLMLILLPLHERLNSKLQR